MFSTRPLPPASHILQGDSFVSAVLRVFVSAFGIVAAAALLAFPRFFLPAEDAVILFQFSRNLAQTGAITFVPHGPRAEGATDFLWMVLLAAAVKLHLNAFYVVAVLNTLSLAAIAFLLLRIAHVLVRPLVLLFVMGVVAMLPQVAAAMEGFSTLPFCFLLVLLVLQWLRGKDAAVALVALLLCLFRPDGTVFALPLFGFALWMEPSRKRLFTYASLFGLPGMLYFLWRWHYFGMLLPLPFLVKANAHRIGHYLVAGSLRDASHYLLMAAVVGTFVLWTVRRNGKGKVNAALVLSLLVFPTAFYLTIRLDQDIAQRFFVYLPAGTLVLVAANWQILTGKRVPVLYLGLAAWLVLLCRIGWSGYIFSLRDFQLDNRKAVATELSTLPRGTMIVTEAGLLPYYSRWTAYDAWGLNTPRFARHLLQPADVTELHPDLLLVYTGGDAACHAQPDWQVPYTDRTWQHLTRNLVAAADSEHYDLWLLPYGRSANATGKKTPPLAGDQECWFVRRDSPLRDRIAAVLERHHGSPVAGSDSTPVEQR